ncbi:MAG: pentapeptide repeat-containing protein [Hyphomicrobiales bacterium]|nr:pentapeptide repeat-containing protein [Hyphomicrobiales bacterium]
MFVILGWRVGMNKFWKWAVRHQTIWVPLILLAVIVGASWLFWKPLMRVEQNAIRNLILLTAGVIGWYFLYQRTKTASKNTEIAEQGLIVDRLNRATEQLASDKSSVRSGGILGLEQIADTYIKERRNIARVLSIYIKEFAPRIEKKEEPVKYVADMSSMVQELRKQAEKNIKEDAKLLRNRRDIESAVEVLARIASKLTYEDQYNKRKRDLCDLQDTELRKLRFVEVNLSDFNFTNSDLTLAWLNKANLTRARLRHAVLRGVFLDEANLKDAKLDRAMLDGANMRKTVLSGARLDYASLGDAKLKHADLRCAFLQNANLAGAVFNMADLSGAYFIDSNLSGAQLSGTNFSGANFQGAKNMRQTQFDDGYYWEGFPPEMPDNPPDLSCPSKTWKLPPARKPSEKEKQDLLEEIKQRDNPIIDEKEDPLRPQDY